MSVDFADQYVAAFRRGKSVDAFTATALMEYMGVGTLAGVDFRGSALQDFDFRGVDVSGADFRDANLRRVDFRGARTEYARFDGARMEGARLEGSGIFDADQRTALNR